MNNSPNIIAIAGEINSGKDTVGLIIQYFLYKKKHPNTNLREMPDDIVEFLDNHNEDFLNYSGWEIKKFAYKLKLIISTLTGCSMADLENQDFKNSYIPEEWNYLMHFNGKDFYRVPPTNFESFEPHRVKRYTYREVMTHVATKLFRDQFHENTWTNALWADYKPRYTYKEGKYEIDTPTKYPNWLITDLRFPNEAASIEKRNGITIKVIRDTGSSNKEKHISETALDDYSFHHYIDNNGTYYELADKVKAILTYYNLI